MGSSARTEPTYLVFSDVDETLISCKSMFDFLHFALVRLHGTEGETLYRATRAHLDAMSAAGAAREDVNRAYYRTAWAGYSVQRLTDLGRAWYEQRTAQPGFFIDETLDALRRHREQGADIILISGSFAPCLTPISSAVNATRLLSSEPVIHRGTLTGDMASTMIGEGKRAAVLRVLAEHPHLGPETCYAYGDHPSDIPMMDCVGNPRGVGGNPRLRAYLAERAQAAHE
ncbi:HAD-IB family hydrolase [Streptomyces sp. SID14515]|uniref:HAD family hydrolase n=1 Tax=Streptomyces sp. SID14515 TaxID=2706074 RepID=UPI0013CCE1DF|nr:HAD-IB family hydrolase [Streptomyces sp. SID14515]NEB36898.1 HAD-IB family hydrolase [Streptomyces sp. SID14515]